MSRARRECAWPFTRAKAPSRALKLCFYAADVAAERARLLEQGVPMGQLKGNADALWFCDGQDPDGNCLQISNRA